MCERAGGNTSVDISVYASCAQGRTVTVMNGQLGALQTGKAVVVAIMWLVATCSHFEVSFISR